MRSPYIIFEREKTGGKKTSKKLSSARNSLFSTDAKVMFLEEKKKKNPNFAMLGTKWEITANVQSPLVAASHPHPHPRTQLRGDQVRKNYLEGMVSPTCHGVVGQGATDAQAGKSQDLIWCVFSLSLFTIITFYF